MTPTATATEICAWSTVPALWKSASRKISILGRYGGDEFVVCLKGATQEKTYAYMQEFQSWLTPLTLSTGEVAELSVSAGGAAYPDQGEDFVSLCRSADAALYEVKQNGKGDFRVKGWLWNKPKKKLNKNTQKKKQ